MFTCVLFIDDNLLGSERPDSFDFAWEEVKVYKGKQTEAFTAVGSENWTGDSSETEWNIQLET